jgi:flagellar biogenesis protein FliO
VTLSEVSGVGLLLVAVAGLTAICPRILARARSPGVLLKVLDRIYLGQSGQLLLLSAGRRAFLLGLCDKRIVRLAELPEDELGELPS